jgi:hypothetical protein
VPLEPVVEFATVIPVVADVVVLLSVLSVFVSVFGPGPSLLLYVPP